MFDFLTPKMELKELIKKCSEKIDNKILKEKEKGSKYIGGTVKIEYDGDLYVEVLFTLYFQDQKKNCFQTDGTIQYKAQYLTERAIKKLKKEGSIEFEIDEPEVKSDINDDIEDEDDYIPKKIKVKNGEIINELDKRNSKKQ